jgi:hypothetical protein
MASPTNQFAQNRAERGHSHGQFNSGGGGYHNFHPLQPDQHSSGNNAGHSIVHGSNHFHQFNLRDNQPSHSRHMVGGSLNNVNLMASADSSLNTSIQHSASNPGGASGISPGPSSN